MQTTQKGDTAMGSQAIAWAAAHLESPPDRLTATPIENPFFRSWRFFRVRDDTLPPRVITVATDGQRAQEVSLKSGFADQAASDPVALASPEEAVRYVTFLLSAADPMIDILSSVDDIPGITDGNHNAWRGKVEPPAAARDGQGYRVDTWLLESGDLVQGRFSVDSRGRVRPDLKVVARSIGVTITLE